MVFFPIDWHLHLGIWEYVGQAGRSEDAVAYYTSLGGVWDLLWVGWLAFNWRALTTRHFWAEIAPRDAFWPWLHRKTNPIVVLTVYRAAAFFGVASTFGWIIWALFVNDFMPHLDWSIGGPKWAPPQGPP